MTDRSYTDAEVEAILRRAIEREQSRADGLGHEELLAAAREIGLPDDALDRAIHEVELERSRGALALEVRRGKRGRFLSHLFTYLTISGSLAGLHLLGLLGAWVWWPAVLWGALLLLLMPRAFRAPSDIELDRAERRHNRQERRRLASEERHRARIERRERRHPSTAPPRTKSPVEAELERVVEEGVSALLRAAANKLRDASRPVPTPNTEFGRYVARKEGTEKSAAPIPVQVRVSVPEVPREEAEAVRRREARERSRK